MRGSTLTIKEIKLTEEELVSRLKNFEDSFIERKSFGDSKDWLKTVVAFANSTPVGYPAILFIGVKDDGTPEEKEINLDSTQRTFSDKMKTAYPPIYYLPRIIRYGEKQILAVVVPGSSERPHFSGPAYVRQGSKTVDGSEAQFSQLIAERNTVAYQILRWKGKVVSFYMTTQDGERPYQGHTFTVVDCNQFFVTLKIESSELTLGFALRTVDLSFDYKNDRPVIGISYR